MSEADHLYSTLLEELSKTVKEKGPTATIALLRNGRSNVSDDKDIQFVVVSVCNQVGVDMELLINEHSTEDTTKYAKGFIVHYLRTDFDVDWLVIKSLLKHKNQSYLWKLMNNIKTLKQYLAAQRDYFEHKIKLDQVIKEYKSKK